MNTWVLLAIAIAAEVAGTMSLRASDGFKRVVPVVIVIVGYGVSFVLLAQVLKRLPIGVVYAIWSAVGISAIAILGKVVWNDPLPPLAIAGLALIVIGIVVLKVAVGPER